MPPRFRPLTSDANTRDEDRIAVDLEQLEAELTASIAKLGGPGDGDQAPEINSAALDATSRFPPLDLPEPARNTSLQPAAPTAPPPATAEVTVVRYSESPAPSPATPAAKGSATSTPLPTLNAEATDLLSELRATAAQKQVSDSVQESERKARIERADHALRLMFRYLTEYTRHLDKIQPAVPQSFRPLPHIELSGLHWAESFVDYRTNGGTEISPLDSVSLRYTLSAGDSVRVEKLPNFATAYAEELRRVGLRYSTHETRSARGMVAQIDFMVERSISCNLLFKADTESETILVRARNLVGLGHTSYKIRVADVDRTLLDELGKHILGRPSQLFQRMIRDAYYT